MFYLFHISEESCDIIFEIVAEEGEVINKDSRL